MRYICSYYTERNSSFVDTEYNSVPRLCESTTSRDVVSVVQFQRSNQTESEFVPFINIISLGEQRWTSGPIIAHHS